MVKKIQPIKKTEWKPTPKKPGVPGASSVDALKRHPEAMKILR